MIPATFRRPPGHRLYPRRPAPIALLTHLSVAAYGLLRPRPHRRPALHLPRRIHPLDLPLPRRRCPGRGGVHLRLARHRPRGRRRSHPHRRDPRHPPPAAVFVAGWWSFYPIERRLHEAWRSSGTLDRGGDCTHPPPAGNSSSTSRHQVPRPCPHRPRDGLGRDARLVLLCDTPIESRCFKTNSHAAPIYSGEQLLGVGIIFLFSPPIIRIVWSTIPLSPGPLRDRLAALLGQSPRQSPPDARLEHPRHDDQRRRHGPPRPPPLHPPHRRPPRLPPPDQIEAVMAHEVGHVRRHHLPWLAAAMLASLGLGGPRRRRPSHSRRAIDRPLASKASREHPRRRLHHRRHSPSASSSSGFVEPPLRLARPTPSLSSTSAA